MSPHCRRIRVEPLTRYIARGGVCLYTYGNLNELRRKERRSSQHSVTGSLLTYLRVMKMIRRRRSLSENRIQMNGRRLKITCTSSPIQRVREEKDSREEHRASLLSSWPYYRAKSCRIFKLIELCMTTRGTEIDNDRAYGP